MVPGTIFHTQQNGRNSHRLKILGDDTNGYLITIHPHSPIGTGAAIRETRSVAQP